jgi:hypothetical protein
LNTPENIAIVSRVKQGRARAVVVVILAPALGLAVGDIIIAAVRLYIEG